MRETATDYRVEEIPAVDNSGIPTTYVSFRILEMFFNESNKFMSAPYLKKFIAEREKDIELICQQLQENDFIEANPIKEGAFKYNLHCKNYKQQCNFEKFLLDSLTNPIPVNQRLRYSPSRS